MSPLKFLILESCLAGAFTVLTVHSATEKNYVSTGCETLVTFTNARSAKRNHDQVSSMMDPAHAP